jgi:hypothetical protein
MPASAMAGLRGSPEAQHCIRWMLNFYCSVTKDRERVQHTAFGCIKTA